MDRREFLSWAGVGWLAASLPVALAAVSPSKSSSAQSVDEIASEDLDVPLPDTMPDETWDAGVPIASTDGFVPLGTLTDLNTKGSLSKGKIVVVRDSNRNEVVAVNPTCTHQGCRVAWRKARQQFACPCHGSRFGSDGRVLGGPAPAPLKRWPVKVEGETIFVKKT